MKEKIKVAFASGPDDLNRELVERMSTLFPDLPLYVVSEFPPEIGRWVPYHVSRGFLENLARCRAAWGGKRVRLAGVLLAPRMPYRRMRLIALLVSPVGFLAFNEHFGSFMLRPRCAGTILRHLLWRTGNFFRWQLKPGGDVYTFFWRMARPAEWRLPLLRIAALLAGRVAQMVKAVPPAPKSDPPRPALPAGITVVIPSRDGRALLELALPAVERELAGIPSEIVIVDNGSSDGTAASFPRAVMEVSAEPLSFARAVNRGIRRARFSHVCLLNNDMLIEPGFFRELRAAFERVPDLFCSTAQIFLPPGVRREETGKAVMSREKITDFPVRCEVPVAGEDGSYVLYGSGGCSLYDTAKLAALGLVQEIYEPAYVEDLDLGYRAWARGWPTVFVAGARVEHRHRTTTSRYYSDKELAVILEVNYLRFLLTAVANATLFGRLWREAIVRLRLLGAGEALQFAAGAAMRVKAAPPADLPELEFLALARGDVFVFPGRRARSGKPVVLVASSYVPFPLSHGGAVRMFNLMRRAAADFDQVLICFSPHPETPPAELLEICVEIVVVRLTGSHSRPSTERPDVVEEFDSPAFHAVLRQTVKKWNPALAQLEFTQMAQYAADCAPAPTVLVEHDITFDLYEQLLSLGEDWELRRQLDRWRRFETSAWKWVDRVVTMSEKDRRLVPGTNAVAIANGVDLERFRPGGGEPEPNRLLFIGSFAHLPNLLALDFFLKQVWPLLDDIAPALHVIAGMRHEYFLEFYKDRVAVDLRHPRVEVEGFVADVRPAYDRAAIVIAPLLASAGTNIKILEAMAMGKAIVSTPAGINGLDLDSGDVAVAQTAEQMASAIRELCKDPDGRRELERRARGTVESRFDWDSIARRQKRLFETLWKAQ